MLTYSKVTPEELFVSYILLYSQNLPDNHHIITQIDRRNLLRSKHHKYTKFKVATWNVQGGLKSRTICYQVISDMEKYGISICALQETTAEYIIYYDRPHARTLSFDCSSPHHGNAFAVKQNLEVYSHKWISDRISVMTFHLNNQRSPNTRPSLITVINAYCQYTDVFKLKSVMVVKDIVTANKIFS